MVGEVGAEGSSQEGNHGGQGAAPPAASTQVEYDDPEAKISKERLVSKMLGGGGGGGAMEAHRRVVSAVGSKVKPAPAPSGRVHGGRSMRPR